MSLNGIVSEGQATVGLLFVFAYANAGVTPLSANGHVLFTWTLRSGFVATGLAYSWKPIRTFKIGQYRARSAIPFTIGVSLGEPR